jgi:hypothetical protein
VRPKIRGCLLREALQEFLHSLDKRQELIRILPRKRFVNIKGLFKSLPRLLRLVLGTVQNTQVVERRGDVRQISFRLFLRQPTVNLQRLLIFLSRLVDLVLVFIKNY